MADTPLPRYVKRYLQTDGKYQYRYNPPKELVAAGIVERQQLGTHKTAAIAKARRLNATVDEYRAGKIEGVVPRKGSRLEHLVLHFYNSKGFKKLRGDTQKTYSYHLTAAMNTEVEGKRLGDVLLCNLSVRTCTLAYEEWASRGIASANDRRRIFSLLMHYAMQLELVQKNPMRYVTPLKAETRKVMWTQEQVKTFLQHAYSNYDTRNIGVLMHMCYEWCQRVGDMRNLTWADVDLDKRCVTIRQSKRSAVVYLPMTDSLHSVLVQQKELYGFQQYVAPHKRASDGAWRPYTAEQVAEKVGEIKEAANLPPELQARDLRRTGITELIIAGVDAIGVMQVSGHKNVASIRPYMVNTLEGATTALSKRFALAEEQMPS